YLDGRWLGDGQREQFQGALLGRKVDADRAAIDHHLAFELPRLLVVDTDHQLGARRQAEGRPDLRGLGILTWQPAREHVLGPRSGARLRRPFHIDRRTAYHRRVARQQVDRADPPPNRCARRDRELLRFLHLVRDDSELWEL